MGTDLFVGGRYVSGNEAPSGRNFQIADRPTYPEQDRPSAAANPFCGSFLVACDDNDQFGSNEPAIGIAEVDGCAPAPGLPWYGSEPDGVELDVGSVGDDFEFKVWWCSDSGHLPTVYEASNDTRRVCLSAIPPGGRMTLGGAAGAMVDYLLIAALVWLRRGGCRGLGTRWPGPW